MKLFWLSSYFGTFFAKTMIDDKQMLSDFNSLRTFKRQNIKQKKKYNNIQATTRYDQEVLGLKYFRIPRNEKFVIIFQYDLPSS